MRSRCHAPPRNVRPTSRGGGQQHLIRCRDQPFTEQLVEEMHGAFRTEHMKLKSPCDGTARSQLQPRFGKNIERSKPVTALTRSHEERPTRSPEILLKDQHKTGAANELSA